MSGAAEKNDKVAGTAAITASTAAVACAVCCVLPLALPAATLATVGGALALFAGAYRWLALFAVLAVVGAWIWVAYQSRSSGKRPARSTLTIMGLATAMMVLALLWPRIEPLAVAMLRR
jgi:hypothetical protein